MLEEFEHLVGIPMKNKLPFMGIEELPKHKIIDVSLHMNKKEITPKLEVKWNTSGFSLKFLIDKGYTFIDA